MVNKKPSDGEETVAQEPKDGLRFKIARYLFEKVGYVFKKVGYVLPRSCRSLLHILCVILTESHYKCKNANCLFLLSFCCSFLAKLQIYDSSIC